MKAICIFVSCVVAGSVLASCGRAGMGRDHLNYKQLFCLQRINPKAGDRPVTVGLDSQEAAIIAKTYRRSLSPEKSQSDEQQPLLLIAPAPQGTAPVPPLTAPPIQSRY